MHFDNIVRKPTIAIAFMFLLSACATTENFANKLNTWKGQNIENVKKVYGAPTFIARVPQTNELNFSYARAGLGQGGNWTCNFWFLVDPTTQLVNSVNWSGNGCKST